MNMLIFIFLALTQTSNPQIAGTTKPAVLTASPIPITLSADDQGILEDLSGKINKLQPDLVKAQKQYEEATTELAQALAKQQSGLAFIEQLNKLQASRQAFLFRVAADVCKCLTAELEFAPDGKSVVRKPKPEKP